MTTEEKIDRIYDILNGTPHQPGLLERVEETERTLRGHQGSMGLVQKVNMMWRVHIWVVGGVGTVIGSLLTIAAKKLL